MADSRDSAAPRVVDPDDFLLDSFRLARKIWEDDYRPDFLVALWRGGAPCGIAIQEFFRWKGHDPYHTAIRTQSLEGVRHGNGFDVKGLEHVIEAVEAEHRLLLVDDIFATGRTVYEVIRHLRGAARRNAPEVRVATVYFLPRRRRFLVGPDYFLHAVDEPPVLPYRLTELSEADARAISPALYEAL